MNIKFGYNKYIEPEFYHSLLRDFPEIRLILYAPLEDLLKVLPLNLPVQYCAIFNSRGSFDNYPDLRKRYVEIKTLLAAIRPVSVICYSYTLGNNLARDGYKVYASVVNGVRTLPEAYALKNVFGYSGFVVAHDMLYDFAFQKQAITFGLDLEVLTTMRCPVCPIYAERHLELYLRNDKKNRRRPDGCWLPLRDKPCYSPHNPLKLNIVTPGMLADFKHIQTFKFPGRLRNTPEFAEIFKASIREFLSKDEQAYVRTALNLLKENEFPAEAVEFFLREKRYCTYTC
jgi:hypothetical protein